MRVDALLAGFSGLSVLLGILLFAVLTVPFVLIAFHLTLTTIVGAIIRGVRSRSASRRSRRSETPAK
jgi:hypothetical protein